MSVTAPKLLSQADLDQRRMADENRLDAIERDIKHTADLVFRYKSGDPQDPEKARTQKLATLDALEFESLAAIVEIRDNSSAAIRQINQLSGDPELTPEQLAARSKEEPAIRAMAESLSIADLERRLRDVIFEGDQTKSLLWARQAELALDRAVDAGVRIAPEQSHEINRLIHQILRENAPTVDRRVKLREPFGETATRAMQMQDWILDARKRRGLATPQYRYEYGGQQRTVSVRPSTNQGNATGYPEVG